MTELTLEKQLDSEYRAYGQYVIKSRAIPSLVDGLKPVQRRLLYVARTLAKTPVKVNTLSGSTMSLHPHGDAALNSAASLMAQEFAGANNFAWFEGIGAFGGRLTGKGIESVAAPRYVSVKNSEWFRKLLLVDYNLTREIPNYDQSETELEHFYPLIPTVLLNPASGIAVGFACEIQPYHPVEIINNQIRVLRGNKQKPMDPWFRAFQGTIERLKTRWRCCGVATFARKTQLQVIELPIGYTREQYIEKIDRAIEDNPHVKDIEDRCRDTFDFIIYLTNDNPYYDQVHNNGSTSQLNGDLYLDRYVNENLTLLDEDGNIVVFDNANQLIERFTLLRLGRYEERFRARVDTLTDEKRHLEVVLALAKADFLKELPTMNAKQFEAKAAKLVDFEYDFAQVMEWPLSRFRKDRIKQAKRRIKAIDKELAELQELLADPQKQKEVYITELQNLKAWFKRRLES